MKLIIPPNIHAEIMYYVNNSTIEISGIGRVRVDGDTLRVTKIYLLEQSNSSTSTDIDETAVADLLFSTAEDTELGNLNFWWHSHVNMAAFWSGTDMDTIRQFGEKGYLISTVFNKKGEYRSAYYQGSDGFRPALFMDNVHTSFSHEASEEDKKKWDAVMKEKCKPRTPAAGTWNLGKHDPPPSTGRSRYVQDFQWDEDYFAPYVKPEEGLGAGSHTPDMLTLEVDEEFIRTFKWIAKSSTSYYELLDYDADVLDTAYYLMYGETPSYKQGEDFLYNITGYSELYNEVLDLLEKNLEPKKPVLTAQASTKPGKNKRSKKKK